MADELQAVDTSAGETRVASDVLQRIVVAAGLILLALTWRLWTPQRVFPQVPLLPSVGHLPPFVDWIGFALMAAGLSCGILGRRQARLGQIGLSLFVVAAATLVLIDQHRLQPWAYQLSVAASVLCWAAPQRRLPLMRLLTIGLYFHSAASKLDLSFFDTNGQHLVGALLESIGLSMKFWSPEMRRGAAAALPVGELLIAVGLAVPRTRRLALYVSIVMHTLLLLALGPWGLSHKPGVLVWNIYFIVQNWILFGLAWQADSETTTSSSRRWVDALVIAVVVLPLLEPWNRFDHWPAWAVYTSHPAKVRVFIDAEAADRLPTQIHPFVGKRGPLTNWRNVSIDRWSLESLNVPTYPQDRFQLGVAIWLARRPGLENGIRIVIDGRANRWTGKRSRRELTGRAAVEKEAERFSLNALPR